MPNTPETAHLWWIVAQRGEHGRDCPGCRRAPGGPASSTPPRRLNW